MKRDIDWFNEARYGMFIHWGPYAMAARGEWVRNRERIPLEEYTRLYVDLFQAEHYDPRTWAELAVEAGMRYAVLTTRHHDGFALWPTETSDYHAGALGPKRDLVGPFVEAFREAGLRVGLYYSPADWAHADYPGAYYRDWPADDDWKSAEARERFIDYYSRQVRELMTWYGKIDYLWYDGCIPNNLQNRAINEEALSLQPDLLINERNGEPWQVKVCEQAIRAPAEDVLWEACMTLNENWGYHAGDHQWKSPLDILRMLTETASKGGNLLLNVGPRADGTIPEASADILRRAGRWLSKHGASIYGSSRSPFGWSNWGRLTTRGSKVYVHLWNDVGPEMCLAEVKNKVVGARLHGTGEMIEFEQKSDRLFLRSLPDIGAEELAMTLELEVEGAPEAVARQTSFWIPG